MRLRTRIRSSIGSMWTSDARSWTACSMMRVTTWTIGAFSSTWTAPPSSPAAGAGPPARLEGPDEGVETLGGLEHLGPGAGQILRLGDHEDHRAPEGSHQQRAQARHRRVAHGHDDVGGGGPDRQDVEILGHGRRDARRHGDVRAGPAEVDGLEPVLLGQGGHQVGDADQTAVDQHLADPAAVVGRGLGLELEGVLERLGGDVTPLDEHLAEERLAQVDDLVVGLRARGEPTDPSRAGPDRPAPSPRVVEWR